MTDEDIFCGAVAVAEHGERAAYVAHACGGDGALRRQVELLLAAHFDASPLDTPPSNLAATLLRGLATTADPPPPKGMLGGRYRLGDLLGEGGMGAVYRAEQLEPVRRPVAVKLTRGGTDTSRVLARFEAERQALAVMDHPGIAKVLDAGTLPDGRPYFVMELVDGRPLTEYCDTRRLTVRERLGLFVQICKAVQHAHQKGVIHRDLKPGNVLVAEVDGAAVCKVIDFGLAKALAAGVLPDVTADLGSTATGTPLYMAPEQAVPDAADIDTRADVYALGAILYELLTGTTPIPDADARRMSFDELIRAVRQTDPPPLTARLDEAGDALAGRAEARRIEPARWRRLVRGDLDWVARKCLEKDRARRYETANAVALEVQRYLAHEPVLAGPPDRWHTLAKFVRRNRGGVIAAAAVAVAVAAGFVGTTVGLLAARRHAATARTEAANAQAAADAERAAKDQARAQVALLEKDYELFTSIFSDLDVNAVRPVDEPLQAVLARRLAATAKHFDGEAVGDPLVVAGLRLRLAESLLGLGYPHEALPLLEKCSAAYERHLGPNDPQTFDALDHQATALEKMRRGGRAVELFADILARKQAAFGPNARATLVGRHNHAGCMLNIGRLAPALPLLADTLEAMRTHLGPDNPTTIDCMADTAACYRYLGRLDDAMPLLKEVLDRRRATLPADHPSLLGSLHHLAAAHESAGDHDRARPLFEQAYLGRKVKLGPSHPRTLDSHERYAITLLTTGRHTAAIDEYARLVAAYRILPRQHKFQFSDVLTRVSSDLANHGLVLSAEPYLRENHAFALTSITSQEWREARLRSLIGWLRYKQGRQAEGEAMLVAAYRHMTEREPTKDQGDVLSRGHANRVELATLKWIVELYEETSRPAEAAKWRAERARYPNAGIK